MVAPTPVSALLHAVAVVKMGVFCVLRVVFNVFGIGLMHGLGLGIATAYLVSFTILMASVYALTRDDLKARLAYSTVSQLSYIVLGAVLLSPLAMVGGIFHIAAHAFSKITLFSAPGRSIARPASGGSARWRASAAGCLDDGGVLRRLAQHDRGPAGRGLREQVVYGAGLGRGRGDRVPVVLLVSSVLNAAYFLPVSYIAFFGAESEAQPNPATVREIPLLAIPLVATAILSLLIGIYPGYFLTLAEGVVR